MHATASNHNNSWFPKVSFTPVYATVHKSFLTTTAAQVRAELSICKNIFNIIENIVTKCIFVNKTYLSNNQFVFS